MISLEDEARIAGRTKQEVINKRRCYAAAKDAWINLGWVVFGGMAGSASAIGANYYYQKDMVNCVALSAISLITAGIAVKSLYEIVKFSINLARGSRDNDPSLNNYLQEEYPEAHLLPPVFVDDLGNPRD